jgi:hypothetical protein
MPIYITSIIQLPLQVITLLTATAFLLLYINAIKSRNLIFPMNILVYSQLIYIIYYLFWIFALCIYFLFGSEKIDESIISMATVLFAIIIACNLVQLAFYRSIKKSIVNNKKCVKGARMTAIVNYAVAILMIIISFGTTVNFKSIILLITNVAVLVLKGIFANSYYKKFTNTVKIANII